MILLKKKKVLILHPKRYFVYKFYGGFSHLKLPLQYCHIDPAVGFFLQLLEIEINLIFSATYILSFIEKPQNSHSTLATAQHKSSGITKEIENMIALHITYRKQNM